LAAWFRDQAPDKEVLEVREPGGTEIAEAIRTLVQATEFDEEMSPLTDIYLYASARAQLLESYVRPALER
jgi:dTMP kinase